MVFCTFPFHLFFLTGISSYSSKRSPIQTQGLKITKLCFTIADNPFILAVDGHIY